MVVGAFPAAKLGVLALKQISKPIATFLKSRAKNSQFFRQYICMPPAQCMYFQVMLHNFRDYICFFNPFQNK